MMSPMIYGRFRNAIIDYYNAVLKAKPATKPYIEWHFGDTRSGKRSRATYLLEEETTEIVISNKDLLIG